ncbi:TPR-like protein [Basidiobolus meristosporus CBS 931.73]|uniref:TPR-like protein n=1 Tax=Basidiobolus meristosporus CBS 931.73 TaxID=1314790 RepID=A0A1Y1XYY0_9FUNG|nr:TPR-like protein [Basidiobolus meristosporus CBS 931.73]|eukprot:ORX90932.1 TPR-like protein [Basidiobolus meristosporus CBS 931.73]
MNRLVASSRLLKRIAPLTLRSLRVQQAYVKPCVLPFTQQYFARQAHFVATPPLYNNANGGGFSDAEQQAQQYLEEGTEALNNGKLEEAIVQYTKSVEVKPTATGYYNLGVCYYQLGQPQEAVDAWKLSLNLSPSHSDLHLNLASVYYMHLKDSEKALEHIEQASNLAPYDGEIFYNYGVMLDASGKLEQAIEKYKIAKELGIERAETNLRNAMARILKDKVTPSPQ